MTDCMVRLVHRGTLKVSVLNFKPPPVDRTDLATHVARPREFLDALPH